MADAIRVVSSVVVFSSYPIVIVSDLSEPKIFDKQSKFKNTETWRSNGKRRKPRIK